jgi:hypothetical protein
MNYKLFLGSTQVTLHYESPDNLQTEKEIRINDEVMLAVEIAIFNCLLGRAIAQAVRRRLPTAAARV